MLQSSYQTAKRSTQKEHVRQCKRIHVSTTDNPSEEHRVHHVKGEMVLEQEKEKGQKVSFKHTPPGSACQNTLPSSNWVIFDTPLQRGASVLMARCYGAKSLRGLPGTESKQAQTLPADNLANPSAHRHKNIQKHGPIAPACTTGV